LTGLAAAAFVSGFRGASFLAGRAGFAVLTGRRPAADARFFVSRAGLAVRAALRLEEVRAFTARRNFAMPGA
jgi:hypothetical protein